MLVFIGLVGGSNASPLGIFAQLDICTHTSRGRFWANIPLRFIRSAGSVEEGLLGRLALRHSPPCVSSLRRPPSFSGTSLGASSYRCRRTGSQDSRQELPRTCVRVAIFKSEAAATKKCTAAASSRVDWESCTVDQHRLHAFPDSKPAFVLLQMCDCTISLDLSLSLPPSSL